jgi:putative ABC transport system permease protein
MRLWKYTAREVGRRPGRALLTVAGIALGLATVVATRLTIDTVRRTYRDLFGAAGSLADNTLGAAGRGLGALSAVALGAAAVVILNSFLLNLGERRRQLAILRALGATRGRVTWLLLREALLLGAAGTVVGCGAGVGLAAALLAVMEQFLGIPLPGFAPGAEPFLIALVLGPGCAAAAVIVPAGLAGRRPPLADLLPAPGRPGGSLPRLAARLPLGLSGGLAAQQLARHPLRTALTAGGLSLALAVTVCFGQAVREILADLRQWYARTVVADFLVYGSLPDATFLLTAALPEGLASDLGRLGDVATVDRLAFLPARSGDRPILVLARTSAADRPLPLALREGDEESVRRGLARGEVVIGAGLAREMGLRPGDGLRLDTARGPRQFRVAGSAAEYAAGGSAVYLDWDAARRALTVPGPHVYLVTARPGRAAALAPRLREFCDRRHLILESNAELRGVIDADVARVAAAMWALVALVLVIASLGIVNTLLMNVHDQRRPFGVLRALGLLRGQLRRVILMQGLLLGVASTVPGTGLGLGLAYVVHRLDVAGGGAGAPFRVDVPLAAGACGLTLAVALLASLLPARRALRLPVAEVLADA